MGRIKSQYLKRVAEELVEKFPQDFTKDFQGNKVKVQEHITKVNPPIRNKIAGTITRIVKRTPAA
ncbi:30S ribosomal protein S17e [uncultured archaeon]|nr:30S ribosomal protein S17e [uncultured archaeon]